MKLTFRSQFELKLIKIHTTKNNQTEHLKPMFLLMNTFKDNAAFMEYLGTKIFAGSVLLGVRFYNCAIRLNLTFSMRRILIKAI